MCSEKPLGNFKQENDMTQYIILMYYFLKKIVFKHFNVLTTLWGMILNRSRECGEIKYEAIGTVQTTEMGV